MTTLPAPLGDASPVVSPLQLRARKGDTGCLFPYVKLRHLLKDDFVALFKADVERINGHLTNEQIPLLFIIANCTTGRAAEVGVLFGRASAVILMGSIPNELELHCVDTFEGTPGEHETMIAAAGGEMRRTFEATLRGRGLLDRVTVVQGLSQSVATTYPDHHFDLVWIDAAHDYDNVLGDVNAWYPKLKPGGLMLGHDYSNPTMVNRDFLELVVAVDKAVKNDSNRFRDFGWFAGIWGARKR